MLHPYIAYTLWGCAAGQGMVYYLLSVAKGIWFRESLSTGYFLQDWFDLLDEFCLFSKYTKVMTIMYHALLQLPINGLKQDCVHFVLCPKQANKIEGVVVNRVCILGSFVLNRDSVKPSAAHLYPNIGRLPTHGFAVLVTTVIAPILP